MREELVKLPSLEDRVMRTAEFVNKAMPQLSLKTVEDACMSFYKKLLIADKYVPATKYQGKATLVKALKNAAAGGALGEDYSLSEVNFSSIFSTTI